jgi:hypothetical protein
MMEQMKLEMSDQGILDEFGIQHRVPVQIDSSSLCAKRPAYKALSNGVPGAQRIAGIR